MCVWHRRASQSSLLFWSQGPFKRSQGPFKRSQGPFKHQQQCRVTRNFPNLPSASCHRQSQSPETPPQTPSSTRSGRQCCSALAVPSTSDPARAPAGRTASAIAITARDFACPLASACKADEKGGKKTLRGGAAEGRGR